MLRRFIHIALNPLFQALVVAGLAILFVPLGLKKYTTEQVALSTHFDQTQLAFADLDHDGISERIHTFYNLAGNVGIALVAGNTTMGQWNFKGIYQKGCARLMSGDFNDNMRDEIYIFTLVKDSVMLHVLEYTSKPYFIIRDRFIAKIGQNIKDPDYEILPGKVTDMNGDGSRDLIFSISAGFSRQPRNVFIYDIVHNSLRKSPESGAFISNLMLSDLNLDGLEEILLSTFAATNYNEDPFPYTDTNAWFMVLDHDLNFLFQPVKFAGPTGSVYIKPVLAESGGKMIMGTYSHGSSAGHPGNLFLADLKGNMIKVKDIQPDNELFTMLLIPEIKGNSANDVIGAVNGIGFYKIDNELNIRQINKIKSSRKLPSFMDVDQDGHDEIIILAPGNDKHVILQSDFHHPVDIDFPIQSTLPVFSVKLNGKSPPQLSVQGDTEWMLFDYGINPVYRFRFLIYLGIYLAVLGFILLIRKLYSFQLKKRYETEQKITRLQLSGIKAQMEPHFIMNTINTIGSSIYRQKPDEAYRLLVNFSGMVRSLLVSSDKLTSSLEEELGFVKSYLELEKKRFGEVFEYHFREDEGIKPETVIPKMIIQLHAENALKHGLLPKKTGGILEISIARAPDNYLVITITDNGIGRNAASKNISQSTGKGMKILWQLFETYNRHNQRPLRQEIEDLTDEENRPTGTRIRVYIPLDFNEGIF